MLTGSGGGGGEFGREGSGQLDVELGSLGIGGGSELHIATAAVPCGGDAGDVARGFQPVEQRRDGTGGEAEFVRKGGGAEGALAEGVDGAQTGAIHREGDGHVLIKAFNGSVEPPDGGEQGIHSLSIDKYLDNRDTWA